MKWVINCPAWVYAAVASLASVAGVVLRGSEQGELSPDWQLFVIVVPVAGISLALILLSLKLKVQTDEWRAANIWTRSRGVTALYARRVLLPLFGLYAWTSALIWLPVIFELGGWNETEALVTTAVTGLMSLLMTKSILVASAPDS